MFSFDKYNYLKLGVLLLHILVLLSNLVCHKKNSSVPWALVDENYCRWDYRVLGLSSVLKHRIVRTCNIHIKTAVNVLLLAGALPSSYFECCQPIQHLPQSWPKWYLHIYWEISAKHFRTWNRSLRIANLSLNVWILWNV